MPHLVGSFEGTEGESWLPDWPLQAGHLQAPIHVKLEDLAGVPDDPNELASLLTEAVGWAAVGLRPRGSRRRREAATRHIATLADRLTELRSTLGDARYAEVVERLVWSAPATWALAQQGDDRAAAAPG